MQLSDFFIRRPVFAIVVNALVAVLGLYALTQLSVRELSQFEVPLATVTTPFPGADSELVEVEVTSRIEDAVSSIDSVDYSDSVSSSGLRTLTVTFKRGIDRQSVGSGKIVAVGLISVDDIPLNIKDN